MKCLQHGWILFRLQTLMLESDFICCREVSTLTELNNELKLLVFTFKAEYTFAVPSF